MVNRKSSEILDLLNRHRLVAILRLDDLSRAVEISRALLDGGVRLLEFTLTNPQALDAVRTLSDEIPEFAAGEAALGVGSVITVEQAQNARGAGAQFLVAPIVAPRVIRYGLELDLPVFPGALTPTEIHAALHAGAPLVKLFPAGRLGPGYLRDVLAPLPEARLMPTGGVTLDNIGEFFGHGAAAVAIGSALLDPAALRAGDWSAIRDRARRYVEAVDAA
jgi:2-dehydro-3-deoxyphosphogluconate aldolase/(4S)-4-hydroxy-2-oxoglutarate aldolase